MITIKSPAQIEKMARAGDLAARVMQLIKEAIKPGLNTKVLDEIAHKYITKHGAKPSFLNYRGFPASICASVNDEVVHGIPGNHTLKKGDIVGVDLGVYLDGYHADMARTFPCGEISAENKLLIKGTKECFYAGISRAVAGNRVAHISAAIDNKAMEYGFGVVRELVGHGIGTSLHEKPDVPNYTTKAKGAVLRPGMTMAIEPMINFGKAPIIFEDDGWTTRTVDGSMSAHYENTEAGRFCISKSGRDKGRVFIIKKVLDENYVLITDGVMRKLDKPKKKKLKHLAIKPYESKILADKFRTGATVFDAEVRSAVAQIKSEHML